MSHCCQLSPADHNCAPFSPVYWNDLVWKAWLSVEFQDKPKVILSPGFSIGPCGMKEPILMCHLGDYRTYSPSHRVNS